MRLMKQNRRSPGAPLDLPKVRKNNLIEIIPINSGCLNQCTYCKTKAARGDLRSYPVEEIVQRVESVQKGLFPPSDAHLLAPPPHPYSTD